MHRFRQALSLLLVAGGWARNEVEITGGGPFGEVRSATWYGMQQVQESWAIDVGGDLHSMWGEMTSPAIVYLETMDSACTARQQFDKAWA